MNDIAPQFNIARVVAAIPSRRIHAFFLRYFPKLVCWFCFWLCLINITIITTPALASVPAGSIITAQAIATYIPANYTQIETIHSNTVTAITLGVEALTMAQGQTMVRPPHAIIANSHLLTNTGNVVSQYMFSFIPNSPTCAATNFNLTQITLWLDQNSDGVVDAGDIQLALNTSSVLRLPAGGTANIIVQSTAPTSVASGIACYSLTVTSEAQSITATNTDTVQISDIASLITTKSAQHGNLVQAGISTISYTITTNNIGNQDAMATATTSTSIPIMVDGVPSSLILLRDAIPTGSHYVAGSLTCTSVSGVRLFRLPGDAPMSYRSNGDDSSAIEVAIGLPTISSNASATMTFSVLVVSSSNNSIINNATTTYNNGIQIIDQITNSVVVPITTELIGLAKAASQPTINVNAQGTSDGTATATFSLRVKNYGSGMLYNVALNDVIEGSGTQFGTYTSSLIPASHQYTIVPGSLIINNIIGAGTKATAQGNFTGQSTLANLIAPGANLAIGGEFTVQFSLRFSLTDISQTLYNSASVQAGTDPNGPMVVSDTSTNGTDPDPDGDGNPTNNSIPTPITTGLPNLVMVKTVSPPRATGTQGVFDVDYHIQIANNSNTTAPNVRLADNLDCTFQMDLSTGPVASWTLLGAPTSSNGILVPSNNFTGHAKCDRNGQTNSNASTSFPTSLSLNLVDGSQALAPGQVEQINFTVQITLKPTSVGAPTTLTNKAWAASMTLNTINITPTAIIQAASNSTDLLLTDPQGVVYNANTRVPVGGAIVTLTRTQCANTTATPIVASELYYGNTTSLYTFNTNGSVSMTTTANGNYQFFFKTPPVSDLCTYHLTVVPPSSAGLTFPSTLIPAQSGTYTGCGAVSSSSAAPQITSSNSDPTTYYTNVSAGYNTSTSSTCQVVQNNIPLDPTHLNALTLQKTGSLSTIELNDFMSYTLTMTNNTGSDLIGAQFTDTLPPGFSYQLGTARLNGVATPDPIGGHGPGLVFNFSGIPLANKAVMTLSYRIKVGVGAPINTDAINRAQARSSGLNSNQAVWRVHVSGGVFSDEAFLFGKVFLDCDSNRIQGPDEVGIPGVRLFLEDGTGVITDAEGKWSLYGLHPVTHALKLDRTTLPDGAHLEILDNRQAGSADSRFVDIKNGEWLKANFAVNNCENKAMVNEVMARRHYLTLHPQAEGDAARAGTHLDPLGKIPTPGDTRGLASSGSVTPAGNMTLMTPTSNALIDIPSSASASAPLLPITAENNNLINEHNTIGIAAAPLSIPNVATTPQSADAATAAAIVPANNHDKLEDILPTLDNSLGFIDLHDGDILRGSEVSIRVKGLLGATLRLSVNGKIVNKNRIGKIAALEKNAIVAYEFISITMQSGKNTVLLEVLDSMNNVHAICNIHVIVPGPLTKLETTAPQTAPGDAKSPVKIHVRLLDENGVLVTTRTAVTLENTLGHWNVTDMNPGEAGTQTFITGGNADFELVPPGTPGDARIRISAGIITQENRIAFLPDLRPLTGIGIVEGVISMHNGAPISSILARDTFEAELTGISRSSAKGTSSAEGRAAFYLKGTIKGEYLLTAAYDSDKNTQTQLFRDIQPDKFYPVYGDSSTKLFDAQSSGRLYLRIDKNRSYLLLGDFTSTSSSEVRQLTQVTRTLTGIQHRFEDANTRITSFASHDDIVQQVVEFPANGTSGPFIITGSGDLLANSEQVQIIVRDRNQPSVILSSTMMTRFTDYTIEALARTILFSLPIPSLDSNLNPQSIRITFAIASGGPAFLVAGIDAQTKVTKNLQLGLVAAYDGNPANIRRIGGMTGLAQLGNNTTLTAEVATTDSDLSGHGQAERIELHHTDEKLHAELLMAKVGDSFDNPSATMPAGHSEVKATSEYKLSDASRLRSQFIYSKDELSLSEQHGALMSVQTRVSPLLTAEIGIRSGQQTNSTGGTFDYGSVSSLGVASSTTTAMTAAPSSITDSFTSVRSRLTANLPGTRQNQVYIEAEQAIDDPDRRVLALGGSSQLSDKVRLYGRYEVINSLDGPYTLTSGQSNNIGLIGLDSTYMKDGHTYEELRLADTMDGRSMQAATGVRNTFTIGDGWKATAGVEHTSNLNTVSGIPGGASDAITGSTDYLGSGIVKNRLRANLGMEVRRSDTSNSTLSNIGVAYKLDQQWSLLARSITSNTTNNNTGETISGTTTIPATVTGNTTQDRQQIGLAYRPVDNDRWNALARFEHKHAINNNGASGTDPVTGLATLTPENTSTNIVSTHINVQPDSETQITGRWAGKTSHYLSSGSISSSTAQLVQSRIIRNITSCWDIGIQAAMLWSNDGTRQRSLGFEAGYNIATNLWMSIGFNVMGLRDPDLTANDYTDKGIFMRLRFKFDETILHLTSEPVEDNNCTKNNAITTGLSPTIPSGDEP